MRLNRLSEYEVAYIIFNPIRTGWDTMDSLIEQYLDDHFTQELQAELRASCTLFEQYDLRDYQNDLISLLMDQYNQSPEDIYDKFILVIRQKLNVVLQAYNLILSPEASLNQINQILNALYQLQFLEEYNAVLNVLDAELDSEEKFAEIIAQHSTLSPMSILVLIESFDATVLKTLRTYIAQKTGLDTVRPEDEQKSLQLLLNKLKLFRQFLKDQTCLGITMVRQEMLLFRPLKQYLPFVHDAFKTNNPTMLAIDLYSFLLLTEEGRENPLEAFRQYGYLMLDDLDLTMKVDVQLTKLINDFERFKLKVSEQILPKEGV